MKSKLLFAALFCCAFATTPANATKILVTYTGKMASGVDGVGLFGAPNIDLTGMTFSAEFTLDPATPGATLYDDGHSGTIYGSSPSAPLEATLRVNGVLAPVIFGGYYGNALHSNGLGNPGYEYYGYDEIAHGSYSGTDFMVAGIIADVRSYTHDFLTTSNVTAPLSYSVASDDQAQGRFFFWNAALTRASAGDFTISNVTVSVGPPPIPEPATWVMAIGGFGLAGAALRRRPATLTRVSGQLA